MTRRQRVSAGPRLLFFSPLDIQAYGAAFPAPSSLSYPHLLFFFSSFPPSSARLVRGRRVPSGSSFSRS